jgi:hypothetical protein
MFYLDYILYIIILILSWVLIYKIINTTEGFDNKRKPGIRKKITQGFQHKGNAFIATSSIDKKSNDSAYINFFDVMQTVYSILNVFAMVFVEFPTKYITKLKKLMQEQFMMLYGAYKSLMQKSNGILQNYLQKFNILGYLKLGFVRRH